MLFGEFLITVEERRKMLLPELVFSQEHPRKE